METRKENFSRSFQLLNPTERLINERKADFMKEYNSGRTDDLFHEMQVHIVELELQNAELKRDKKDVEALKSKYENLFEFSPTGYITFDHEGYVQELNFSICNMLGISKNFLMEKMFHIYIEPEMREDFNRFFIATLCEDAKQSCQLKLRNKNGEPFYALLEGIKVENEQNGLPQCRVAIVDVTQQRIAEEALIKSSEELRFYKKNIEAKALGLASTFISLAKSERDLRKVNLEKENILKVISEELKQPIFNFLKISRILDKEGILMEQEELVTYFKQLLLESENTNKILENLLKWPLVINGKYEFSPSEYKLHKIVEDAFALLKKDAAYRQVKFIPVINKKTKVIADKSMLQTIISSLITKTINYSTGNGEVSVQANEKEQFVEIIITDSVKNPRRTASPKLNSFAINMHEKIKKADNSELELLLCKELIEAQGGTALFGNAKKNILYKFTIPCPTEKASLAIKISPPKKLSAA
jgi:PAS domain S-box-containing protein